MTRLDFPVTFLDIEGLARRWKCSLSEIEALAETDKLKFYLRPAALEIALGELPPEKYLNLFRKITRCYLDHRYVYLMFKDKGHKVSITHVGNINVYNTLSNPLCVDFFDLIIPIEQVEEFEFLHSNTTQNDNEFELLSDDFTCLRWQGQEYKFGEIQAKIIKLLWQARESGKPWMYGKRILREIGSNSYRIKDIFNHNKYWRKLVKADRTGKYKLNLPPKQLSLFE